MSLIHNTIITGFTLLQGNNGRQNKGIFYESFCTEYEHGIFLMLFLLGETDHEEGDSQGSTNSTAECTCGSCQYYENALVLWFF